MKQMQLEVHSGAEFSKCRTYRYRLWRVWDDNLPRAVFCLLNPSTADETENDPTIERQQRRVLQWARNGYLQVGGIEVVNAFSYCETYSHRLPKLHQTGFDLVGPDNDKAILEAAAKAAIFICGWGKPGVLGERDQHILKILRAAGVTPFALEINNDGTPKHPLYVGYARQPQVIE